MEASKTRDSVEVGVGADDGIEPGADGGGRMHCIASTRVAARHEVKGMAQHPLVERMPEHDVVEQVELSYRLGGIGASKPMEQELLSTFDAQVESEVAFDGASQNGAACGAAWMFATDGQQQYRRIEEERAHDQLILLSSSAA